MNAPNTIHTIHTIHYTQYTPIHPIHTIHPTHPKRGGSVALGRPITPHPTHPKRASSNILELAITAALTKFSNFEDCIYFEMSCSQVSCTCIRFPFFHGFHTKEKRQIHKRQVLGRAGGFDGWFLAGFMFDSGWF